MGRGGSWDESRDTRDARRESRAEVGKQGREENTSIMAGMAGAIARMGNEEDQDGDLGIPRECDLCEKMLTPSVHFDGSGGKARYPRRMLIRRAVSFSCVFSRMGLALAVLGALLAGVLLPGVAAAQTTWVQRATGSAVKPPRRYFTSMVYDSFRGVCVLFGGRGDGAGEGLKGDTWEWDGNTWTERQVPGPAPREQFAMAYDSARHVTVLFGGNIGSNTFSGETWEWDGTTWTQRMISGPSARKAQAMTFDSTRGVTVLTCGQDSNSNVGDVWEYNGVVWSLRLANSGFTLAFAPMSFDPVRNVSVLYGAEWNGVSWHSGDNIGIAYPYGHGSVYDTERHLTVTSPGNIGGGSPFDFVGEYDGTTWTYYRPEVRPANTSFAGFAYDSARGRAVQFGGFNGAVGVTDQTWELVACVRILAQPFSRTACPGSTVALTVGAVAAEGSGPLLYQWRKGGVNINPAANSSAATASLFIPNASGADTASYDCVVSVAGCGSSTSASASVTINCVPFASAGAGDSAGFSGARPTPGPAAPPVTFQFQSLTIGAGGLFGLGPNEILNLANGTGTLTVGPGGTFYGNGTILGSVFNAGLFIIPITQTSIVSNTHGGVVHIDPPATPNASINIGAGGAVNLNTLVQLGNSDYENPAINPLAFPRTITINAPAVTLAGTAAFTGSVGVTGSFTQAPTGELRLFIAGATAGELYSRLNVGQAAALEGFIQVVLQPETFEFVPDAGATFDMIRAEGGITLPTLPATLTIRPLMTAAGAVRLGLTLPPFVSAFAADPNQLVELPAGTFTLGLAEDSKVLRITMVQAVCETAASAGPPLLITCPQDSASFSAHHLGSGPITYQWQWRATPAAAWTDMHAGVNVDPQGGPIQFTAAGFATATVQISGYGNPAMNGATWQQRCVVSDGCGGRTTNAVTLSLLGARCQPADIASDNGEPLPPHTACDQLTQTNSGVNEGDYNAFFNTFFTDQSLASAANIAYDDGTPLPLFGAPDPGLSDNGVNEGDYNCFFNNFFSGCPA
ncbi:hypothetical protein BH11PLA1_BH11PLA1_15530 [soil metagenome]